MAATANTPNDAPLLDPDRVLSNLNLSSCQVLADVGCGEGHFTLPAARLLAPGGTVVAIDLSQESLGACKRNAQAAGLRNVTTVLAEEDDEYPVATASADVALMVDVYHECDPTSGVLREVRRILKPGGILLLVDWLPQDTEGGPPQEQRVEPQDAIEEFTVAGFVLQGACEAGHGHYALKFVHAGGPNNTGSLAQ